MKFVVVLTSASLETVRKGLHFANYAYIQGDQVRVFLWETRDQLTEVAREKLFDLEQGGTDPPDPIVARALWPAWTSDRLERTDASEISKFYTFVKAADQVVTF